tara:strand:- start:13328 stop:13597 length:270 start_codon:yes stop_codon:yes gene_type:complete
MQDFLLGSGIVLILIQVTGLIQLALRKYPEYFLGIIYGMILIDGVAVIGWASLLKPYSNDHILMLGGVGFALLMSTIHKIKKFLTQSTK